jgi:hypothetical protein
LLAIQIAYASTPFFFEVFGGIRTTTPWFFPNYGGIVAQSCGVRLFASL